MGKHGKKLPDVRYEGAPYISLMSYDDIKDRIFAIREVLPIFTFPLEEGALQAVAQVFRNEGYRALTAEHVKQIDPAKLSAYRGFLKSRLEQYCKAIDKQ